MTNTKFDNTDLQAYRGDTETFTFSVTQSGSAKDLTGYTIIAYVRSVADDFATIEEYTITDGQNGNVFSTGTVVLVLAAADTAALPGECVYDIQATLSSAVTTLARGRLKITPDVTR